MGDVLVITDVTVNDGQPAGTRVEYFAVVLNSYASTNIGQITIEPASSLFSVPATYTHTEAGEEGLVITSLHRG